MLYMCNGFPHSGHSVFSLSSGQVFILCGANKEGYVPSYSTQCINNNNNKNVIKSSKNNMYLMLVEELLLKAHLIKLQISLGHNFIMV